MYLHFFGYSVQNLVPCFFLYSIYNAIATATANPVEAAVLIWVAVFVIAVPFNDNVPTKFDVPVTVKLSAIVVSEVVCPIVTAIPEVEVAIFKAPTLLSINELHGCLCYKQIYLSLARRCNIDYLCTLLYIHVHDFNKISIHDQFLYVW